MNQKLKDFLKLISIPLSLLLFYLSLVLVWKIFNLPSEEELLRIAKEYFAHYGLWLVFFGALLEGFLVLGNYFPGGFIIFLGVITAGRDVERVVLVVAIVSVAFFISYTLNYIVGKYGWYKLFTKLGMRDSIERAKIKLQKKDLKAIILSYWEPNLASITATAAGILQLRLRRFLFVSAIGIVIWNAFWGTFVSLVGEKFITQEIGLIWVFVVVFIWIGIIVVTERPQQTRKLFFKFFTQSKIDVIRYMKKVYIVHGWDGSPDEPLFKWLDEELSKDGFLVERLEMPNPKAPVIEEWLSTLKNSIEKIDEETIFVAHSVGCQAVMRYLETQSEETRILGLVLLAPWMKLDETTIEEEGEEVREIARPWMETPIDFEKVKKIAPKIIAIFSDNDVFVELDQKEFFEEKLNAKTIVEHNKGHFSPADNISELPSALEAIKNL